MPLFEYLGVSDKQKESLRAEVEKTAEAARLKTNQKDWGPINSAQREREKEIEQKILERDTKFTLWGVEFEKGVPVEVNDPELINKMKAMGCFEKVNGKSQPKVEKEPEPEAPKPIAKPKKKSK